MGISFHKRQSPKRLALYSTFEPNCKAPPLLKTLRKFRILTLPPKSAEARFNFGKIEINQSSLATATATLNQAL
jgi:hypothetical protein